VREGSCTRKYCDTLIVRDEIAGDLLLAEASYPGGVIPELRCASSGMTNGEIVADPALAIQSRAFLIFPPAPGAQISRKIKLTALR